MSRSGSEVGMTPLRAIVFDAFETLYSNTRRHWHRTFQEVCRTQRLPIDPRGAAQRVGPGGGDLPP